MRGVWHMVRVGEGRVCLPVKGSGDGPTPTPKQVCLPVGVKGSGDGPTPTPKQVCLPVGVEGSGDAVDDVDEDLVLA